MLLFLETKLNFKMLFLINQLSICENFVTFLFVLLWSFKQRHLRHHQLNLNFSVYLVRLFSHQRTLKLKIIKPWVTNENVRPTLNHWIIQNVEKHEQCSSVPKQKRILIQNCNTRGDAWLRRISANNLLPLENVSGVLKTLLLRCPIVFGLP